MVKERKSTLLDRSGEHFVGREKKLFCHGRTAHSFGKSFGLQII